MIYHSDLMLPKPYVTSTQKQMCNVILTEIECDQYWWYDSPPVNISMPCEHQSVHN